MSTPMIDRAMEQLQKQAPKPVLTRSDEKGFEIYFPAGSISKGGVVLSEPSPSEIMVEISQEAANKASRMMLIHSIIMGLQNLIEDAMDPPSVQAAIDAVRRIR